MRHEQTGCVSLPIIRRVGVSLSASYPARFPSGPVGGAGGRCGDDVRWSAGVSALGASLSTTLPGASSEAGPSLGAAFTGTGGAGGVGWPTSSMNTRVGLEVGMIVGPVVMGMEVVVASNGW